MKLNGMKLVSIEEDAFSQDTQVIFVAMVENSSLPYSEKSLSLTRCTPQMVRHDKTDTDIENAKNLQINTETLRTKKAINISLYVCL